MNRDQARLGVNVVSLHEVLHQLRAWRGHVSFPCGVAVGATLDDALVSRCVCREPPLLHIGLLGVIL